MKAKRKLSVTVLTVVAIAVLVGAITPTALATQTNPINDSTTSTSTPSPTPTEEPTDERTETLGDLVVHNYRVENGTMIISMTWVGETPESVTLQEMIPMDGSGTAQISLKTVRLLPGTRTEVPVDVSTTEEVDAVMVSTPPSIERGEALLLRAGGEGSSVGYRDWWLALSTGVAGTILTFGGVKKWRDWRAEESLWDPIDD